MFPTRLGVVVPLVAAFFGMAAGQFTPQIVSVETDAGVLRIGSPGSCIATGSFERVSERANIDCRIADDADVQRVRGVRAFTTTPVVDGRKLSPFIVMQVVFKEGPSAAYNLATTVTPLRDGTQRYSSQELVGSRLASTIRTLGQGRAVARVFLGVVATKAYGGALPYYSVELESDFLNQGTSPQGIKD